MRRTLIPLQGFPAPVLFAAACLLAAPLAPSAEEPLAKGDSVVTRNQVNVTLHVPAALAEAHGPAGILVYFGGTRDTAADYSRPLGLVADALDLVVMVPQLPWFEDPGKVQPAGIYPVLGRLVDEATKQFQLDAPWLIVGGASAGGSPAHELAQKWGSKLDLLLLSSTGPFSNLSGPRTLHVVADKELARLGPQGHRGTVLGQGKKDMFAIPGGRHSAQFKHLQAWLETEVSALRLEAAPKTVRLAEEKIAKGETDAARAILKSTFSAAEILGQPAPAGDAFFQYETKRRQELLQRHAATLATLGAVKAKMDAPPPAPAAAAPALAP